MKPTTDGKTILFHDALHIFWDWRQASIPVQVCIVCAPGSSENVRVSIDGMVRLVDSEGVVTISDDGREIDLDLRGCEITRAREAAKGLKKLNPLDPDSILQVKFPNGEACLVFPYRRVASSLAANRRAETGEEWMQEMISRKTNENPRPRKFLGRLFRSSTLHTRSNKSDKARIGKTGPPIFPMAAFLFVFALFVLVLTPSSIPNLMVKMGVRHKEMSDPGALVWVIPQNGNYYCSGSVLHGREPGRLMKQENALTLGYQPAMDRYCQSGEAAAGKGHPQGGLLAYLQTVRQGGAALFSQLTQISHAWLPQS